eukprot:CAMPEP_0181340756 /NCGR_PEP_ID=MMETSP1101-20121128/30023_1 /TAXON_ID=46948 /ORGANISM="Rhodomonas abbreviata, Strain Caron Lab Isolate" /LENGTH=1549 /DNA_ID=CAMNT_0023451941 /DNA_START=215 /DNA_END=4865 /DNA_ORIENTATION=+
MTFPISTNPNGVEAGRAAAITFKFIYDKTFQRGDTVTINVPGFSSASNTFFSPVVSNDMAFSAFLAGTWDAATNLITLTHLFDPIAAFTEITVTIGTGAQIELPLDGIVADDPAYQIRTDTHHENTNFRPLDSTEPIGVLYNTSLTYSPKLPSYPSQIALNFTPSANLMPGDSVFLSLAQFSLATSPISFNASAIICENPLLLSKACSHGNLSGTASETGGIVTVTFSLWDIVYGLESVSLWIDAAVGITLPELGSSENNALLTLATDSAAGPVGKGQIIESSDFVSQIGLSYDPPKAGTGECLTHSEIDGSCLTWRDEGVDITFSLTDISVMAANDIILLTLPNFTRSTLRQTLPGDPITSIPCTSCDLDLFTLTGISSGTVQQASWSEANARLTVFINGSVPAYGLVSFTIPSSAGLVLPAPLQENWPALKAHVLTAAGTGTENPIPVSVGVGAFVSVRGDDKYASTSFGMPGARAGFPGALNISFTLTGAISTGQCVSFCGTEDGNPIPASVNREVIGPEVVTIELQGFRRLGGDLGHIETSSARFGFASWEESRSILTLTSTANTPGGMAVNVVIPASAGIMLPSDGMRKNVNLLSIATNAESGPVPGTAVAEVQPVGYLISSSLAVAPLKAGVPVEINVTLAYSQKILARETFRVELPGFSRDDALPAVLSVQSWKGGVDFEVYADWDTTGTAPAVNLVMGAGGVDAGSELLVAISIANGITLRESGMAKVARRKFWRVANADAVAGGWLVAEVSFFRDAACSERLVPLAGGEVASMGEGLPAHGPCSLVLAAPAGGCPNGTRSATVAELAACKQVLCDVNAFPEYLVAEGASAHLLGRGYGCTVSGGAAPAALGNADLACTNATLPAAHATDNSSRTWWWAGSSAGDANGTTAGAGYVGVELSAEESVQCAVVEQGVMEDGAAYAASEGLVQASADGVAWFNVLGGRWGVSELSAAVSGTDAFSQPSISTDAERGPIEPTRMSGYAAIGSFGNASSVQFGTPVAGEVTRVVLKVTPQMEIAAGEEIAVVLAGFSRDGGQRGGLNVSVMSYATTNGSVIYEVEESVPLAATWDEAARELSVVLARAAPPGYPVTVTVFEGSYSCSSVNSTSSTSVTTTTPGTNTTNATNTTTTTTTTTSSNVCSINRNSTGLRIPAAGIAVSTCGLGALVQPGEVVGADGSVSACGTCAGCSGVVENEFIVSTNATAGPVLRSPGTVLRSVQRVGVIANSSLSLSLESPAFPVALTLNFTFNRPVSPGDTFYLHLPDFLGEPASSGQAHSSVFGDVHWDRSMQLVTLTVAASAPAMTPLSVTVPASLGIKLPAEGLTRDWHRLKVSTDSAQGVVLPIQLGASPPVGAFTGDVTRLAYEPGEFETDGTAFGEGRAASISVGFSLNRRIASGEWVAVFLPDFSRADGDAVGIPATDTNVTSLDLNFTTVDTNGVFSAFTSASWTESTSTLTLFAAKSVAADQRHVVLIPASAGIRLPKIGLVANDVRILISTNAALGPNSGTPVDRSPALSKVCAAECSAWAFTCAGCECGPCAVV